MMSADCIVIFILAALIKSAIEMALIYFDCD